MRVVGKEGALEGGGCGGWDMCDFEKSVTLRTRGPPGSEKGHVVWREMRLMVRILCKEHDVLRAREQEDNT